MYNIQLLCACQKKGWSQKLTQQKYVLQVKVIAIVELASNKIQPVPKKNELNSKCVETKYMRQKSSTIANLRIVNQKQENYIKKMN